MPSAPRHCSASHTDSRRPRALGSRTLALAAFVTLAACNRDGTEARSANTAAPSGAPGTIANDSASGTMAMDSLRPPPPDTADLRVEIDLARRQLAVIAGSTDTIARHRVAVGSPEWPTRPGTWTIDQVVLNPAWTPPDESWAEEREPKEPGAADNPLGTAQLVYDLPRTIHGTNDPASIGKAVSHGSIRVSNTDAIALSRLVLERTGVPDVEQRLTSARAQRTVKQVIDLPKVVPIRVY